MSVDRPGAARTSKPTSEAAARFKDLCIDAADVAATAVFWSEVLGLGLDRQGQNTRLTGPTPQHTLWVNDVPEARTVKQRVHLDVFGSGVAN